LRASDVVLSCFSLTLLRPNIFSRALNLLCLNFFSRALKCEKKMRAQQGKSKKKFRAQQGKCEKKNEGIAGQE